MFKFIEMQKEFVDSVKKNWTLVELNIPQRGCDEELIQELKNDEIIAKILNKGLLLTFIEFKSN
jgi:hypothetical protein